MALSAKDTYALLEAIAPLLAVFPRRAPRQPVRLSDPDSDIHYDNGMNTRQYAHQTAWEDGRTFTILHSGSRRATFIAGPEDGTLLYLDTFGAPLVDEEAMAPTKIMIASLKEELEKQS